MLLHIAIIRKGIIFYNPKINYRIQHTTFDSSSIGSPRTGFLLIIKHQVDLLMKISRSSPLSYDLC